MPGKSAIWIDKLQKLDIDGDGVRIALSSDDYVVKLRMSRAQLRCFIERGRTALDDAEREQRVFRLERRG